MNTGSMYNKLIEHTCKTKLVPIKINSSSTHDSLVKNEFNE